MNSQDRLFLDRKSSKHARIFCIGDLMLDQNSFNSYNRLSPEGPFLVLESDHDTYNLGGAGNVFNNLISLNKKCYLFSVVGNDDNGKKLLELVEERSSNFYIQKDKNIKTSHKKRLFAGSNQMLRIDDESTHSISIKNKENILKAIEKKFTHNDIMLISDYDKGLIDNQFSKKLISLVNKIGGRVVVDPKSNSFQKYSNAFLVKPNFREFCLMCGEESIDKSKIIPIARKQIRKFNIKNILITRGDEGVTLVSAKNSYHFSSTAKEVYDVSGAGDTVISCLSYFLAINYSLKEAIKISNIAAGIVVGKLGASTVSLFELFEAYESKNDNIYHEKDFSRSSFRSFFSTNKKIGFTNGCFDILHEGHIKLLKSAKQECDFLILGLNSDTSVKMNKGNKRPINSENERAVILKSIKYIDMIIIFESKTPYSLIKKIKPDLLIKGSDYKEHQVIGADFVKSYGGKIKLVELAKNKSTTNLINKII